MFEQPMTFCQRFAVEKHLAGWSIEKIRAEYKKIPSPTYDFETPEKHIREYENGQ